MRNTDRAKLIAEQANRCCSRSDGYEHNIEQLALGQLQAAYREGYAAGQLAGIPREDMGR